MKKTFTLSIPQPCHEKWEQFNPTTLGGFCSSCQKEVIDFTSWDEDRIKSYFKNRSQTSCGRFYPTQLRSYTLQEPPKFNFIKRTFIPFISLMMMLSSRDGQAQKAGKPKIESALTKEKGNTSIGEVSQPQVITGVVKSAEDQSPLPGVNVLLKGSVVGTVTDADGQFSITISNPKPTDTLQFSFIGLVPELHNTYESHELAVFMKLDFTQLSEKIVVGGVCARRFSLRNLGWRIGNLFRRR